MDVLKNIETVNKKIKEAAQLYNRDVSEIKLVAVTKTKPVELIKTALENGILYIGENKVQEAAEKLPKLAGLYKEFHFIGHLQSNKINKLLKLNPTLIHSIDNYHIAEKLDNALERLGKKQDILIQVNTSGEISKYGVEPSKTKDLCMQVNQMPNLNLLGLMTIGKLTENQIEVENCFKILEELFENIKRDIPQMKYLSMGMSGDFELAIKHKANILRIGSAIFGRRTY